MDISMDISMDIHIHGNPVDVIRFGLRKNFLCVNRSGSVFIGEQNRTHQTVKLRREPDVLCIDQRFTSAALVGGYCFHLFSVCLLAE